MIFTFVLFVLIGFLPFISAFFALGVNMDQTKKVIKEIAFLFPLAASAKLFLISVLLPEVQGYNIHTFIVTLVLHSLEFLFIRKGFVDLKIQPKNRLKSTVFSFWWAAITAVVTSLMSFISNSRQYELEVHHITYAIAVIYNLFVYFACANISLANPPISKPWIFTPRTQIQILLIGLPAACSSLDLRGIVPAYVPDLLCIMSAAFIWFWTEKDVQQLIKEKQQ